MPKSPFAALEIVMSICDDVKSGRMEISMILITGGAYEGKTNYASDFLKINPDKILDGGTCPVQKTFSAVCIKNFHKLVKRLINEKMDPIDFVHRLIRDNSDLIIITDEIGCGIIPANKSDRLWREAVGRVCSMIASESECVIRLSCGIPTAIKGELL